MQQQIRSWFATLLGPAIPLPEPPIQVEADGDHFRVFLPLDGIVGRPKTEIAFALRPLDGDR